MEYKSFLEQFKEIEKKALFILNHKGYNVNMDTSVKPNEYRGINFDEKSIILYYAYHEIYSYEIPIELIQISYADLEAKFSANLKEYEEYKKMKKKFG